MTTTPLEKLDPELKAQWLTALRSGKYKQGTKQLRSADDEFCCIGVYCDLLSHEAWSKEPWFNDEVGTNGATGYTWDGVSHTGPPEDYVFMQRLRPEAMLTVGDQLIDMNDGGASFAVIADWIEENL